jgi:hypothetical protein
VLLLRGVNFSGSKMDTKYLILQSDRDTVGVALAYPAIYDRSWQTATQQYHIQGDRINEALS